MLFVKIILAGIFSGVLMGFASELLYRIGVFKSSLILIDGNFAASRLKVKNSVVTYFLGIFVHLLTSAAFGAGYIYFMYFVFGLFLKTDPGLPVTIAIYTLLLWLAMLFAALPAAGHGWLGRKLSSFTWLEQLILHLVYGAGFYGAVLGLGVLGS